MDIDIFLDLGIFHWQSKDLDLQNFNLWINKFWYNTMYYMYVYVGCKGSPGGERSPIRYKSNSAICLILSELVLKEAEMGYDFNNFVINPTPYWETPY